MGIYIGMGSSRYKVTETNWQQTELKDTFNSVYAKNGSNIYLGMQYKLQFTNKLFYRQRFQLTFETANFGFDKKSTISEKIKKQNLLVEIPIHFIYQSDREKIRLYIFVGFSPKYSLGQDTGFQKIGNFKKFDLSADFGIGVELKLNKYAIVPEISFSNGMINVYENNGTSYSGTISKLRKQNINFTIAIK